MATPRRPHQRFAWDAKASRYRRASNGRFVPRKEVRRALDRAIERAGDRMTALGGQLARREISLREFQSEMRQAIKESHLYATAAARGGWAQMNQQDILAAGRAIGQQYRYLQQLTVKVQNGLPLDGKFTQRLRLYGRASRAQYHATERLEMGDRNGMDQERNIRAPGDSCGTCLGVTALGWVELGSLPLPGSSDRDCRQNCRCQLAYRNSATGAVAA